MKNRKPNSHKGDYGRVLIVAGSYGMVGAAILASRGALRAGAGLVYLAVPRELVNFVNIATPEVITLPFEKINEIKADVIAIGPGLGVSDQTKNLVSSVVSRQLLVILDADALNVIARHPRLLLKRENKDKIIMTPHPGEMSRLLGRSIDSIQADRSAAAKLAAKKFNAIVVLKGHGTVVASADGRSYANKTGNPGMASGGMGDVLTGMIAGLIGQGFSTYDAAVVGVHLHGLAGDLAAKEKGEAGLIASDLVSMIPYAIQKSH